MAIASGIAVVLVLLTGLVALIGVFLPKQYDVARMVTIPKDVSEVWRDVSDPSRMRGWRKDLRRVLGGRDRHGNISWVEVGWMSRRKVEVMKMQRGVGWVARADDGLFPVKARLQLRIQGGGSMTMVELREQGVIRSPFVRFLAKFVIGTAVHVNATLGQLAAHHGADPDIRDAGDGVE